MNTFKLKCYLIFPYVVKLKGKKSKGNSLNSFFHRDFCEEITAIDFKYAFFPKKVMSAFDEVGKSLKTAVCTQH